MMTRPVRWGSRDQIPAEASQFRASLRNAFLHARETTARPLAFPAITLDLTTFYNFISGTMITLFVVALIVILVYEYEVLRRSKT